MIQVDGVDVVLVDLMKDDEELVKAPRAVDVASEGSEVELSEVDSRSSVSVDETVLRVNVHDVPRDKYVVEVKKTVETEGNPVPLPPNAVEDELPWYGGLTVDRGGV